MIILDDKVFLEEFFLNVNHIEYYSIFRQQVKTVHDLIVQIYKNYPLDSVPYMEFRSYLEDHWFKYKYPTEFVLCYKRKSPYPNYDDIRFAEHFGYLDNTYSEMINYSSKDVYRLHYKPRWEVEWNPNYVHIVVGGLLHTSDNKTIILHRHGGEFDNKLTTIMGHCAYTEETVPNAFSLFCKQIDSISTTDLRQLLMTDLRREIREEAGVNNINIDVSECFYRKPNTMEIDRLSYYHAGFLFDAVTNIKSTDIVSQEPDKNTVVVCNHKQLASITKDQTDGWLYELLCKKQYIEKPTQVFNADMFRPK